MSKSAARSAHYRSSCAIASLAIFAGVSAGGSSLAAQTWQPAPPALAMQPLTEFVVVSSPTTAGNGTVSIFDGSGFTLQAQQPLGWSPLGFVIDPTGKYANTINTDGTMNYFPVKEQLEGQQVNYNTNPNFSGKVSLLFSPGTDLWGLDAVANSIIEGVPTGGVAGEFGTLNAYPSSTAPVALGGLTGASTQNYFPIDQNIAYGVACNTSPHTQTETGTAGIYEVGDTVYETLPVGVCPVYATVTAPDGPDTNTINQRVFVLNRGSDSITVLQGYGALDNCPAGTLNQSNQLVNCPAGGTIKLTGAPGQTHAGPVYAEYSAAANKLIVANYDGNDISIIDVSEDMYGNDSPTFGTITKAFTNIGIHPVAVTITPDGTRAFVVSQGNSTTPAEVSIVDLKTNTVRKQLGLIEGAQNTPIGHPRTSVGSFASSTHNVGGTVFFAMPDSDQIATVDVPTESLSTTKVAGGTPVPGNVIDIAVTETIPGVVGNHSNLTRLPGAGQPCNLWTVQSPTSISDCQRLK